jgi:hypothetical protein
MSSQSTGGLRRALFVRLAARRADDPLVISVAGGTGALLRRRDCHRLVSLLDPAEIDSKRHRAGSWLERLQVRRSAAVLVPDRATAMRFAAQWRLNLARVHLTPNLSNPPAELIARLCGPGRNSSAVSKPWYLE